MELHEKLRKILKIGSALVLLAPVVYNINFIFPYIFLKNIFFRGVVLILLLIFVIYLFEKNKWRGKGNYTLYGWFLLLLVLILATVFGIDPSNSFWGGWERMDGLLSYLLLGIYFFILINVFTTKRDWIFLMRASVTVALAICVTGFFRGGLNIINNEWSYLGNSAFLGYYLLLNLGLLAIVFILDKSKWRWLYGILGIVFLFVLFGAASRAPILGLFLEALIFGAFRFKNFSKLWKAIFVGLILLVIMLGSLAVAYKDSGIAAKIKFIDRLAHISRIDPTTGNRLLVWGSSWQAFLERPILGYGPENIPVGVNKHYNPLITEQWFDRTHNFVLDYLLFGGILGLIAYLLFIASGFYYAYKITKNNPTLGQVLGAMLAAMMFTLFFIFDTINSWIVIMALLAFISWAKNYQGDEASKENDFGATISKIYYPILIMVVLGVVVLFNATIIKPVKANLMAGKAYRYSQADPQRAINYYDEIFSLHTFGEREMCMALLQYATTAINAPEADMTVKKLVFEKAEEKSLQYLEENQRSMQVRLGLAQLYLRYASYNVFYLDKAIDLLINNINDSPGRVNIYFVIASAYNSKGENDKAIYYLEKSYEVTKEVKSVYTNLMNLYTQKGEVQKVDETIRAYLEKFKDLNSEEYRIAAEYYFKIDMIDASKRILLDNAIPTSPNSWRPYVSYASILESEGKIAEAAQYLSGVSVEHPDFAEVLNEYIEYLNSIKK